jgi:hypothetical protein
MNSIDRDESGPQEMPSPEDRRWAEVVRRAFGAPATPVTDPKEQQRLRDLLAAARRQAHHEGRQVAAARQVEAYPTVPGRPPIPWPLAASVAIAMLSAGLSGYYYIMARNLTNKYNENIRNYLTANPYLGALQSPDRPRPASIALASLGFRQEALERRQERDDLLPRKGWSDAVRDNYKQVSYQLYQIDQTDTAQALDRLLHPTEGAPLPSFEEVGRLGGATYLAWAPEPINGTHYPERGGELKTVLEYFLAQATVDRLRGLFSGPIPAVAGRATRDRLEVTVRLDKVSQPRSEGTITFTFRDASGNASPGWTVRFGPSPVPVPLRWLFPLGERRQGISRIPPSSSGDELSIVPEGGAGAKGQVSFVANDEQGIPVADWFGPSRIGELQADVAVERRPGVDGDVPSSVTVQILVGGDDGGTTGTPPVEISTRAGWRRLRVPVDLGGAERWKIGLTALIWGSKDINKVSVSLKNVYIMPTLGVGEVLGPPNPGAAPEYRPGERLAAPMVASSAPPSPRRGDRSADEVGPRYVVYEERSVEDYPPAMHMPDAVGIAQDTKYRENPHSGSVCYMGRYQLDRRPWVATAFTLDGRPHAERNFDMFRRLEARRGDRIVLRFWARSPDAARAQFKVGGGDGDSLAFAVQTEWIELEPSWRRYEIDLTDKDLTTLRFAFVWVMDRAHNDVQERTDRRVATLMLDDVYFTKLFGGRGG